MDKPTCLCKTCQHQQNPNNKWYCAKLQDSCSGECVECDGGVDHCPDHVAVVGD